VCILLGVDDDPGQLDLQVGILKQIPRCAALTAGTGESALPTLQARLEWALSFEQIIGIFQQELDAGWRDPEIGQLFLRKL
jgi:hypothetical protein